MPESGRMSRDKLDACTKKILVVESAQGQLARLVKESLYGKTVEIVPLYRPGVGVTPEEVIARSRELVA